ncbi:MAG TPA: hypothetical protein VGN57_19425 [Pirellulaceae bacterium]|nr:hypothetical protein [Pirellulaceae bacterium]
MNRPHSLTPARLVSGALVATLAVLAAPAFAADSLAKQATWRAPTNDEARAAVQAVVDEHVSTTGPLDGATVAQLDAMWAEPESDSAQLLYRTVASFAAFLPEAKEVVEACARPYDLPAVPQFAALDDPRPAVRDNLRLYFGVWLVQNRLFEEGLATLEGLKAQDVVDPASLFFHRAVAQHRLIAKEECLASLDTLLENGATISNRYRTVAKLMQADLAPLEPDSLDEIARIMRNVQGRLDRGRAGKRVRDEEGEIVDKLDKMIEELEKQQQQQQASAGGGSNPSSPMQDSVPGGGTGPGDVDPKALDPSGAWGNLPEKEREEALQDLSRDLPAHYREVIEEYFRKLARDER